MQHPDYITLLKKFFRKTASPKEIEILSEWLHHTESQKEFQEQSTRLWEEADTTLDKRTADIMWTHLARHMSSKSTSRYVNLRLALRIAATVLLPILCGFTAYWLLANRQQSSSEPFIVSVDCGQKASLTLPDGTKVWLNSATTLTYDTHYNQSIRAVSLDGEAYFEVAKDKRNPFVVHCDGIEVEALGTAFDVKGYAEDNRIVASLVEGCIRVSDNSEAILLKPGERVVYSRYDGRMTRSAISDLREVDFWRNNMLIFNATSLPEIASTLERMYGVKVLLENADLATLEFTGTIRNTSLHNVFYILSLTYPLTYTLEGDTVRINQLN